MASEKTDHYALLCIFQGRRCALLLECVCRVLPMLTIHARPVAPHYLLGEINFAGESVCVMDVAMYFGFIRQAHYTLDDAIVLCETSAGKLGILVDDVLGVVSYQISDVRSSDVADLKEGRSQVRGVFSVDRDEVLLLDADGLFPQNLILPITGPILNSVF